MTLTDALGDNPQVMGPLPVGIVSYRGDFRLLVRLVVFVVAHGGRYLAPSTPRPRVPGDPRKSG